MTKGRQAASVGVFRVWARNKTMATPLAEALAFAAACL
jgi:hypothetical protein